VRSWRGTAAGSAAPRPRRLGCRPPEEPAAPPSGGAVRRGRPSSSSACCAWLVTDRRARAVLGARADGGHHRDWGSDDFVAASEGGALRVVWGPVQRRRNLRAVPAAGVNASAGSWVVSARGLPTPWHSTGGPRLGETIVEGRAWVFTLARGGRERQRTVVVSRKALKADPLSFGGHPHSQGLHRSEAVHLVCGDRTAESLEINRAH
jgi:hypothetical protein